MKRIRSIVIIVVLVIIAYWLFMKYKALPSFSDLFKPKPVLIENTPIVVKQIQAIAQLITVSAYEELVADTIVTDVRTIDLPLLPDIKVAAPQRRLVIVGKTTTNIGIDMQRLRDGDISGTKDSIHIVLPAAQVLDAIINPSNTEIFIEEGIWDNVAIVNLKNKIRYLAISDVMSKGLLGQSEQKATEILTNFFKAAGYQKVVIQFRGSGVKMQ